MLGDLNHGETMYAACIRLVALGILRSVRARGSGGWRTDFVRLVRRRGQLGRLDSEVLLAFYVFFHHFWLIVGLDGVMSAPLVVRYRVSLVRGRAQRVGRETCGLLKQRERHEGNHSEVGSS